MALPTSAGGFKLVDSKFYTSTTVTDATKVKTLCTALRDSFLADKKPRLVWILTGTHGTAKGELVAERKFFWSEDKGLESQMFKAVDVFHFSKPDGTISKRSWDRYTGANAIIVLAWCFSEQSRTGWMKDAKLKDI